MTSPTMRALFLNGASERLPISRIANRMRRCTGFWPSSTDGSARPFTTLIAYARYARDAKSERDGPSPDEAPPDCDGGGAGGGVRSSTNKSPERSSSAVCFFFKGIGQAERKSFYQGPRKGILYDPPRRRLQQGRRRRVRCAIHTGQGPPKTSKEKNDDPFRHALTI